MTTRFFFLICNYFHTISLSSFLHAQSQISNTTHAEHDDDPAAPNYSTTNTSASTGTAAHPDTAQLHADPSVTSSTTDNADAALATFGTGALARQHRLWPQIADVCEQQLHHARQGVGEGDSGWQLFADEGEMRMYRREEEIDGMVVDPLKACHVVQGVSAKEMCHYFFMPEYRNEWESE